MNTLVDGALVGAKGLLQSKVFWANAVGAASLLFPHLAQYFSLLDPDTIVTGVGQGIAFVSFVASTVARIMATKQITAVTTPKAVPVILFLALVGPLLGGCLPKDGSTINPSVTAQVPPTAKQKIVTAALAACGYEPSAERIILIGQQTGRIPAKAATSIATAQVIARAFCNGFVDYNANVLGAAASE
jgi:hypothetical protein